MRRAALAVLAVALVAAVAPARADHLESLIGPNEPARDFPPAFMALLPEDAQATSAWRDRRVGGWGGGGCPDGHVARRPVVFVHGNTEEGSFWRANESGDGTIVNVRNRMLAAGWCADEIWAISYTGARGYFTYNEVNTAEVAAFVEAVRTYTGAAQVDVIAHSLGVTVVRRAAQKHAGFREAIQTFVGIAGANQGTTTCRGAGTLHVSHVCEEVEPGSAWLAALNANGTGIDVPRSLAIYDGTGVADTFFLGPDGRSPEMDGACLRPFPFMAHNTLARGAEAVATYLAYLQGADCSAIGG